MKPAKIDVNHLLDKTRRPYTENNKITITIGYYDSLKKNKKKPVEIIFLLLTQKRVVISLII